MLLLGVPQGMSRNTSACTYWLEKIYDGISDNWIDKHRDQKIDRLQAIVGPRELRSDLCSADSGPQHISIEAVCCRFRSTVLGVEGGCRFGHIIGDSFWYGQRP